MRARAVAIACLVTTFVLAVFFCDVTLAQRSSGFRRVGVQFRDGAPQVSVSIADLANDGVRRALESGLRKTIVVTVDTYTARGDRLVAQRQAFCTVTYDLWEDRYVVRSATASSIHRSVHSVVNACLVLRQLRVGSPDELRNLGGERVYFIVSAEFNPITRAQCRRMLGNAGSDDPIGPVVANIVRREICRAERSITFRTQAVTVPQ